MLSRSGIRAGSRSAVLAVLVLALAASAPTAPADWPHPPRASASTPRRPLPAFPPTSDRLMQDTALAPAPAPGLRTLLTPIHFTDATAAFAGAPVIVGSSGILVDIDRDITLWSGYEHARRAPASTVKMMTSLVALENFPLDQIVTVTSRAAARDVVETRMGLIADEKLTVKELLTGMLTVSANDAAMAMADGTVGMDPFVDAMNRQVSALGLKDTRFTNPVGFPDDPQEISSAYDLAAIATAATRNFPIFAALTASREVDLPPTPAHREYKLHNINRLLDIYPAAVGTKSGFTDNAGPCLVSMAIRDGHRLVAVVMNAPKMFDQSRALLEWGFTQEGLPALYPAPTPAAQAVAAPPAYRRTRR